MKTIRSEELYNNLSAFLKSRGIELTEGSYSDSVRKGCSLLTDAINLGQKSLHRAKTEVDRQVETLRQVIHEKTAPRAPRTTSRTGAKPKPKAPGTSRAKAAPAKKPAPTQRNRKSRG